MLNCSLQEPFYEFGDIHSNNNGRYFGGVDGRLYCYHPFPVPTQAAQANIRDYQNEGRV
jgi:hypothetical protein